MAASGTPALPSSASEKRIILTDDLATNRNPVVLPLDMLESAEDPCLKDRIPSFVKFGKGSHIFEPFPSTTLGHLSLSSDSSFIILPNPWPLASVMDILLARDVPAFKASAEKSAEKGPSCRKIRNWPRFSAEWLAWVARLRGPYSDLWREVGVYELVELSTRAIDIPMPLLEALLRFWSPGCNAFILEFSPLTITLQDIFYFTGLPVTGEENIFAIPSQDPKYTVLSEATVKRVRGEGSYTSVAKYYTTTHPEDPVTNEEHVMFLWVLLSQ